MRKKKERNTHPGTHVGNVMKVELRVRDEVPDPKGCNLASIHCAIKIAHEEKCADRLGCFAFPPGTLPRRESHGCLRRCCVVQVQIDLH